MAFETDLLIIGAGVAGIATAHAAREAGLTFRLIEAKGRLGGRAWTEDASLGVPFDQGAHFLHRASQNPFRDLADQIGADYLRGGYPVRMHDERWLTPAEQATHESQFRRVLAAAAAGGETDCGPVMNRWPADVPHGGIVRGMYEEFLGAGADMVTATDHAGYRDTFEDWPMRDGFGALIARYGAGLPVILDCPVKEIDTSGRQVIARTPRGDLRARHVIVTVSTGVLAAGGIRFRPVLPSATLEALQRLPMGYAGKIAFRCERGALAQAEPVHAVATLPDGLFANLHVRPFERPIAVAIVGGPDWEMIERSGTLAMEHTARAAFVHVFGADALSPDAPCVTTSWLRDPFTRGGHSLQTPGSENARLRMSEPVHDRLHFAGEATSQDAWATVHGAHASARVVIARLMSV